MNEFLFEVDPSIEEALREENGGIHADLAADLMRGHHAKLVIAEMNDLKQRKLLNCAEQIVPAGDMEFRLLTAMHGPGFHTIAQQEGTYDIWDPDQSDYLSWMQKRHPETRVKHRTGRTVITNQFKPPTL